MSMNSHGAWTTAKEFDYIERVGQFSDHTQRLRRSELLKNYFHAMQQRARWDGLQRDAVLKQIFCELTAALQSEGAR